MFNQERASLNPDQRASERRRDGAKRIEREDMKKKNGVNCFPAFVAMAIGAALFTNLAHGQTEITNFGSNGELSWDDPGGTGTHYAVQWASAGISNWSSWQDAEANLTGLEATGTVAVPMFYRV